MKKQDEIIGDGGTKYVIEYDYETMETKILPDGVLETYYTENGEWITEIKTVGGVKTTKLNEKIFNPQIN